MTRLRTRMLAAGTAVLVAAAVALPATAPAFATAGPTFDVSAEPEVAVAGNTIEFFTLLQGMPLSCYEEGLRPVVTYSTTFTPPSGDPVTSSGTFGGADEWDFDSAGMLRYRLAVDAAQAGWTYELSAASADPCFGDGQTFSDSASVTIPADDSTDPDPYVFEGDDTIHGILREQTVVGGTTSGDYAVAADVDVVLVPVESAGPEDAVDSAVTDVNGYFELTAPVEESADEDIAYVLLALFDDEWFFYTGDDSPASPSSPQFDDAAFLYPYSFDGEASYDLYAGFVPGLSTTDHDKVCDDDGELAQDVTTATVDWQDVCLTDGTVDEAETAHREDAFDTFGDIVFTQFEGSPYDEDAYLVTADSYSTSLDGSGQHFSFTDEDVWAYDEEGTLVSVDVVVTRTIKGSWMSWTVSVYEAGTSNLATDVPFYFLGELGSDSDTEWTTSGGVVVSTDGEEGEDPVIGHRLITAGTWSYTDGDDEVSVLAAGSLQYVIAVIDYCGEQPVSDALDIMAASTTLFGTDIDQFENVDCPAVPAWSIPAPVLTVGVPYDHTFTAPTASPWDWAYGGSVEAWDLPAGLEYEVVDEWQNGTAPGLRIFGTPLEAGPYSFTVYLQDDYSSDVEFAVNGTVRPEGTTDPVIDPELDRSLDLSLGIQIGDPIQGASATAEADGLEEGADYDIVVRSTPQTLGVGTVPTGGVVTRTVTLPALEAGWHSLTFTSTWAGGGSAVGRLWFQVSADGKLVAVSNSAPGLAYTGGSDPAGGFTLAALAIIAGFGLVVLRRRGAAVSTAR